MLDNFFNDLRKRITAFSKQIICILIDTIFLCFWIAIQYLLNEVLIPKLRISGLDQFVYVSFQIIFAVSTLTPVVLFIYKDLRIMFIRTKIEIKHELNNQQKFNDK